MSICCLHGQFQDLQYVLQADAGRLSLSNQLAIQRQGPKMSLPTDTWVWQKALCTAILKSTMPTSSCNWLCATVLCSCLTLRPRQSGCGAGSFAAQPLLSEREVPSKILALPGHQSCCCLPARQGSGPDPPWCVPCLESPGSPVRLTHLRGTA